MSISTARLFVVWVVITTMPFTMAGQTGGIAQRDSDSSAIRLQIEVYEVSGESLQALKPLDLDGLLALVAQTGARRTDNRSLMSADVAGGQSGEAGGGQTAPALSETAGLPQGRDAAVWAPDALGAEVRLLAAPTLTVPAGNRNTVEPTYLNLGQTQYLNTKGSLFPLPALGAEGQPVAGAEDAQLREIYIGLQLQVRAWLNALSGDILLDAQLTITDFEGFTEIAIAGVDGVAESVFIPILQTQSSNGTRLLKSGKTEILSWQERFLGSAEQPKRSLRVVTVTAVPAS